MQRVGTNLELNWRLNSCNISSVLDGLIGVKLKFLIAASIRKETLSSRLIKRTIKIRFFSLSPFFVIPHIFPPLSILFIGETN